MTDDPMVVTVREEAELADGRVPRTLLDRARRRARARLKAGQQIPETWKRSVT